MWILLVRVDNAKDVTEQMIRAKIEEKNGKIYISPRFKDNELRTYELIKADALYEMIHEGVALSLHRVCVEKFSVSDYRKKYGMSEDEEVTILIDSVTECLFCSKDGIALDFSHCSFMAVDEVAGVMFDDNVFCYGKVNFSYSRIEDYEFSMKGCHFINCNVAFNFTTFADKDIYFNEMVFEDKCSMEFRGTDFGEEGEVTFCYAAGLAGSMDFYKCNFGEKMLDFSYMNCPECQFSFWEIETSAMSMDFVDSIVSMILLYKVNINGLLDFRIMQAEHIVIQESVIRDCVLLGNQGYRNYTSYCLKKSTLLGRLRIQNKFSKRLFNKQLQYVYDSEHEEIVLCPTSATDKANQLTILSENYLSEGETDNADAAYVLSKRYRSIGRVHDIWTDYQAVGRTEEYKKSLLKRFGAYFTITVKLIAAIIAWLFEKIFLDVFCGNYATKPSKFLFWILSIITGFAGIYYGFFGMDGLHFQMENTIYQTMNGLAAAWLYSLQIFLQIESGDLMPNVISAYYFMIAEKIIGLAMFSVFAVSYTRKVIK